MRRIILSSTLVLAVALTAAPAVPADPLPPGGTFSDDDGSIHEGAIEAIAAAGVTQGCNPPFGDRFCPDEEVTRGQMAAFLVRALQLPPGGDNAFADDDGSIFEDDIDRLAAAGVTLGCDPNDPSRYCPDRAVRRDQMASFLARALGLPPSVPPPRPGFELALFAAGLERPVHLAAPTGDDRVFVVEQPGVIRLVVNGNVRQTPFLDIRSRVVAGGERGLLSIAFHPEFAVNGRFFVSYSAPLRPGGSGSHTSRIAEFTVSADPDVADPGSERTILAIDQPASNHNGGLLRFGPDGLLYAAFGDGGGGNDPGDNAHDVGNLLGTLIRIDVDAAQPYAVPDGNPFLEDPGADEIWAFGLRNPWRFTIDGGDLYVADVGQGAREEINVMPLAAAGVDYGWRTYEGTSCTGNDPSCDSTGLTFPVLEYTHAEGCSITGGEVYRGSAVTQLQGHYVYSDYCSGFIRSFRYANGAAVDRRDWTVELGPRSLVTSFGLDGAGELYLLSGSGAIWKFVPAE